MGLHAGYAVAFSFSHEGLQRLIHVSWINDIIRTKWRRTGSLTNTNLTPALTFDVTADLFLEEPRVVLDPNIHPDRLSAGFLFSGDLTFQASGKQTIQCGVQIELTVSMPLFLIVDRQAKTVQLGFDPRAAFIRDFQGRRTSGPDPAPIYGVKIEGDALQPVVFGMLLTADPRQFVFSLPLLDDLVRLDYQLSAEVKVTARSLNIGIDIANMTSGVRDNLVDLNSLPTEKGFRKTYTEFLSAGDDQYGGTVTDVGWTATTRRQFGPHNTQIASMLNWRVFQDVFETIGRHAIIEGFERSKFNNVVRRLEPMKFPKDANATVYSPSAESRTVITHLGAALQDDHLLLTGKITHYTDVAMPVSFTVKMRIVSAGVDGTTAFLSRHQGVAGFRVEIYSVDINRPEWMTALQVFGAVVGIVLAPFTGGISLIVTFIFEVILEGIVSTELSNAATKVPKGLAGHPGRLEISLPGSNGPKLGFTTNDIVLKREGIRSWFNLDAQPRNAKVFFRKYSGTEITWPVRDRSPIEVVFDDAGELYNRFDTRARISWEVFGDTTAQRVLQRDARLNRGPLNELEIVENPKVISIDHAGEALTKYDRFIIRCRVYRAWGNRTDELFQKTLTVEIADRLRRERKFVRWKNRVFYIGHSAKLGDPKRQPTGWQMADRKSAIHYTDPLKRCRFADRYTQHLKRDMLDYFDTLPFELSEANNHRHLVCEYCFFGGPDKTTLR